MIVGADILAARKSRGWSRRKLAQESGLTEGATWRVENRGATDPTEELAIRRALFDETVKTVEATKTAETTETKKTTSEATDRRVAVDVLRRRVAATSRPIETLTSPLFGAVATVDQTALGPDSEEDADDPIVQWVDVSPVTAVHGTSGGVALTDDVIERLSDEATAGYAVERLTPRLVTPTDLSALDGVRRVSNSELQTFKNCRRRWWLAYYRGLRLRHESPIGPRAVGDRVHRALKAWYLPDGEVRTDPRDALERLIVEDWTTLTSENAASDDYPGPPLDDETMQRFRSEADLERAMVEGYVQWLSETGADSELRVIASETYLEADLADDLIHNDRPVRVIGKLDVRVRRTSDDVRLVIDHKTVGSFATATAVLPLDEQMLTYMLLEWLNTDEGETRCDGALYNMLRRVKRTAAAKPPFYQRVEVRHNVHELDSMRRRVIGETRDVLHVQSQLDGGADHRETAYPTPTRDCAWRCPFFVVCGMFDDGSRAEDLLEQYYVKDDPLGYYQIEVGN